MRAVGICKAFGAIQALRNVTISLPDEGIVGIIGPNGAGKSTLINILTGFLKPDSGDFFLDSRNVNHLSPFRLARAGISRTFQSLRLFENCTVKDNVMLALQSLKQENFLSAFDRRNVSEIERVNGGKALEWLEFVGLHRYADARPAALSYGQQKLLSLAMCMASESRIIFLDEPASGIDFLNLVSLVEILRKACSKGVLIVMVEHNLEFVSDVASMVVLMGKGEIVSEGQAGEIINQRDIMEVYLG